MTIPNLLTFLRLLSIPVIVYLILIDSYDWALYLSIAGCLTDFFDGYLARKLNQESVLGALLDPVSDKLFEMILLLTLYLTLDAIGLPLYYLILLYLRNTLQLSVFPVLMWWKKIPFKVEPKLPAKWASAMGMIILNFFFIYLGFSFRGDLYLLKFIQVVLIPIAAILEFYMLVTFIPRYVQVLRRQHNTFN